MSNPIRFGRTLLAALVAVVLSFAATERANAQIVVGGGIAFTDLDPLDLGIQGNAYFGLPAMPELRIGGDIVYYFPQDGFDIIAFNVNAQYHFPLQPGTSVYGLAGLSLARWSFDDDFDDIPGFEFDTSGTETGLNLGGGIEFGVGFGSLYGEAKFVTGDLDRFVVAGGVRIPIN